MSLSEAAAKAVQKMILTPELEDIVNNAKGCIIMPESREELMEMALGSPGALTYDVNYEVPGKSTVREASVVKCKNGIVVNFDDTYMRRRDPNSMVIADDLPTDKITHMERFGTPFEPIRQEALEWIKSQEALILMPFYSGNGELGLGYPSVLVAPANAAFFACALADLQGMIPAGELPDYFKPRAVVYAAPPFRHMYYEGKQVVIHNRRYDAHEVFSFNLYPGPSAKKGIYAVLLDIGETEKWVTLHASTVQVVTPYELSVVIMHEGASGGGKSEMLEHFHRTDDGRLLLATNLANTEKHIFTISDACELHPVTDDMAMCPPTIQNQSGKLVCADAEDGWFVRVNHITAYGTDPETEKNTISPKKPLVFMNMDAIPGSTCLLWEPIMDDETHPCPNPRVIIPRKFFSNHIDGAVEVDVRSFGIRQPPATRETPSYGIAGLFHILPPALAWLWRVAAPRGFANPSIIANDGLKMESEGVGSYWPFATGKRVYHANLLLEQILHTLQTRYVLIPNQHIGNFKVGFAAEWLTREYLTRRGGARFNQDSLEYSRCSLLGYSPSGVKIEGAYVPKILIHTNLQPDLGADGYDAGAKMLNDFFKAEVSKYLTPDLNPLGRRIIQACLEDARVEEYNRIIPIK